MTQQQNHEQLVSEIKINQIHMIKAIDKMATSVSELTSALTASNERQVRHDVMLESVIETQRELRVDLDDNAERIYVLELAAERENGADGQRDKVKAFVANNWFNVVSVCAMLFPAVYGIAKLLEKLNNV